MLSGLSNGMKIPETIREIGGLMILKQTPLEAYDLLQGYDVGVDLCEHSRDAFDTNPAIHSPAFVNVVGGDSESIHGYT
jgi:hypothetical protein